MLAGLSFVQIFEQSGGEKAGAFGEVARFGGAAFTGFASQQDERPDPADQIGLRPSEAAGGGDREETVAGYEKGVGLAEKVCTLLGGEDLAELEKRGGFRFRGGNLH